MNEKWNQYWQKLQSSNRKMLILSALFLVGLALIVYSPEGDENQEPVIPPASEENASEQQDQRGMSGEERELAANLEEMLGRISGVGKVKASVELATSTNSNYAFNTDGGEKVTQEKDQSGGTRTTMETTESEQLVLVQGSQGSQMPVVEKEIAPDIAGVMVVAEGASSPEVRARLFQAVQISLGVAPHKVIILPMERGES